MKLNSNFLKLVGQVPPVPNDIFESVIRFRRKNPMIIPFRITSVAAIILLIMSLKFNFQNTDHTQLELASEDILPTLSFNYDLLDNL